MDFLPKLARVYDISFKLAGVEGRVATPKGSQNCLLTFPVANEPRFALRLKVSALIYYASCPIKRFSEGGRLGAIAVAAGHGWHRPPVRATAPHAAADTNGAGRLVSAP